VVRLPTILWYNDSGESWWFEFNPFTSYRNYFDLNPSAFWLYQIPKISSSYLLVFSASLPHLLPWNFKNRDIPVKSTQAAYVMHSGAHRRPSFESSARYGISLRQVHPHLSQSVLRYECNFDHIMNHSSWDSDSKIHLPSVQTPLHSPHRIIRVSIWRVLFRNLQVVRFLRSKNRSRRRFFNYFPLRWSTYRPELSFKRYKGKSARRNSGAIGVVVNARGSHPTKSWKNSSKSACILPFLALGKRLNEVRLFINAARCPSAKQGFRQHTIIAFSSVYASELPMAYGPKLLWQK